MWIVAVVFLGLMVLAGIFFVSVYNKLVTKRNRYENAFSQIDVQLKRRHDLIPNLVETAKGYMKHESETLEAVIAARNKAASAEKRASQNPSDSSAMQALMGAESMLSGALGNLMVTVEDYPELKADEQMSKLMEELSSTENRIAFARQAFNDSVTSYNIDREKFPAVMVANMFGFQKATLFEIEVEEERQAPQVAFG
ncbi:LemA family protein [Persicimonas caeni]|jgi:LemA protein|uniref:LemA family protein n=1 Tax=Persicimonas caeni TaxID=2292766 RepID=A0A4Y6PUA5_PERCE|nr:LemA family protein [Persicimonas caeni]QDG51888.1 LemA family protein [Persicimonas caeni]QED33109.1 LemA family protein [Persicimonas caeni]